MTQLPEDDEKLIRFLQQYRPVPPPLSPNLERQSIRSIISQKQQNNQKSLFFWFIPSAIVTIIGVYWIAGDRNYQIADNIDDAEIENILSSSWQAVTTSPDFSQESNIYEADLLLITGEGDYQ
jgi:hypothetical protein